MIDQERPRIITDDYIVFSGMNAFERYSTEAKDSAIPASFSGISRKFSLDLYPELSVVDVTQIILETRFDNEPQAWLALKYAEAIAAIKSFDRSLEYDFEGPITNPEDTKSMFLNIGIAVVNEFADDTTEAVKQTVESYFETHPQAMVRLEYLKRQAEAGVVH